MVIKAQSKLKGMPNGQNTNMFSGITFGRKRNLMNMAPIAMSRNRRLSRAVLKRIFIIMLGVVFLFWSALTVVIFRRGNNTLNQPNTVGPPMINQRDKSKILREHYDNLRKGLHGHHGMLPSKRPKDKDRIEHNESPLAKVDKKEADMEYKKQHDVLPRKNPTRKDVNDSPPAKFKDMEEVDIHEMNHPHEINKVEVATSKPSSRILTAHLEPIRVHEWETKPLPVRNTTKKELTSIEYPRVNSCSRLLELWPTDDFPDADPFLPWIHDVFPTDDGRSIQFVAQNKRRCQTGTTPDQLDILEKMQPQLSLFQHVPLKRVHPKDTKGEKDIRYQLTSHEEADPDGVETRFICRFSDGQETLSQFNFDYEYVATRKLNKQTFTKEGHKDGKSLHTSQLIFKCPVPKNLVSTVREGTSVVDDRATLFVSLIPVRTPPRYGAPDRFLPPRFQYKKPSNFSVALEWGDSHILPRVEDSGRWENIPICLPTYKAYPGVTSPPKEVDPEVPIGTSVLNSTKNTKKHRVVAAAWAALSYSTRGDRFKIDDGARRADEWIRFHLLTGIDHIFIYDNSRGETGLKDVTDQFPGRVTRVKWPATICNNNRNFNDSPGERSSQYAAESSWRLRFGPHTDWMASMDIDEFIAPVGEYTSIKPFLSELDDKGTKIVSFGSWRAWPRRNLIVPPVAINNKTYCDEPFPCFDLKVSNHASVLQTYNCDRQTVKTETMPAEKQIYRPDYVLQHWIHFSTVTKYTMMNQEEMKAVGLKGRVAPDPLSRFADEQSEVTMLHTKAIAAQDTAGWEKRCTGEMKRGTCRIGVPFPNGNISDTVTKDSQGWIYNCYVNQKIENYWVPLLEKELMKSKIIDFKSTIQ